VLLQAQGKLQARLPRADDGDLPHVSSGKRILLNDSCLRTKHYQPHRVDVKTKRPCTACLILKNVVRTRKRISMFGR
jgi:hypothetical protein